MKHLSILGSTGSIGTKALEVARRFPERFRVSALAAGVNVDLLARQIREFSPSLAVVKDKDTAKALQDRLGASVKVRVLWGPEAYIEAASQTEADTVVSAIVGGAGLLPTLAALEAGKTVALANKETLVMAGSLVMAKSAEKDAPILPIDSEHSAIFQCLAGRNQEHLARLWLTASGGPFRDRPRETFGAITLEEALRHPTWSMGKKITVDSATLMNKGLEVMEARWLFNVEPKKIKVVVHPQSIIHSMVELVDGSFIAQMGTPDMLGAVALALSHPSRLPLGDSALDFFHLSPLTFQEPDLEKFPCLSLAFWASEAGKTYPAVLNASNEAAVEAFLNRRIGFTRIPELVAQALGAHAAPSACGVEEILAADVWARVKTQEWIRQG